VDGANLPWQAWAAMGGYIVLLLILGIGLRKK
jgi:hypothetical protein